MFPALNGLGVTYTNSVYLLLGTAACLFWFCVLWVAVLPQTDLILAPYSRLIRKASIWVTLAGCIFSITLIGLTLAVHSSTFEPGQSVNSALKSLTQNTIHYNDGTALNQQAAVRFIQGKNPYDSSNIITAMDEFGGALDQVTPLRQGAFTDVFPYPDESKIDDVWNQAQLQIDKIPTEFESHFNYPAGSFVLAAPFILAGVTDFHWVLLAFAAAAIIFGLILLKGRDRMIFGAAVIASVVVWNSLAGGDNSILALPFVVFCWLSIKERPLAAALSLGVAASTKQTAWFLIPFALILIYTWWGKKQAVKSALTMSAVFLVFNLPFIVSDPGLWLNSVLGPMKDSMFPLGTGIVTVVTGGVIDIRSSLPFALLEGLILIAGIVWYWFNAKRFPNAGLILAVLPFFFAWRSLNNYFFYTTFVLLAAVLFERGTKTA